MSLDQHLSLLRQLFDGFNHPADERALLALQEVVGRLPPDVLNLYRDHDGQAALPHRHDIFVPCRLMPIDEAIKTSTDCASFLEEMPMLGRVALLWTDDNSNYLGVYTTGLLSGWLTLLNHEEPILVPAYRSVGQFFSRLLAALPGMAQEGEAAYDLRMVPRELPVMVDEPLAVVSDRQMAATFVQLYENEPDADVRRLYGMCAICLTPVADTESVLSFCRDPDMWTPEAAVRLLEFRRYRGDVDEIERLAREGSPNGDGAAMRLLVRMDTDSAREAITRLKTAITGQKLNRLEQWLRCRHSLQPPRWP